MPNRVLREGILTSEAVNSLNWAEEVFYRRLISVVDDFGRYYASPKLLRAACYPLHIDKVSDPDIGKWLSACETAALVRVYPASDGKRYLEILNFRQQVRSKVSKFPSPDVHMDSTCIADATQMQSFAHLDGDGDGDGDGADTHKRTRSNRKAPIPPDFAISDRVARWADEKGHANLDRHFEYFVSAARARGYTYVDWDDAFMNAIRNDWAKLGTGETSGELVL